MRNRFAVHFEELSNEMKDHIICIQLHTNLKFDKAEDWTAQNQGWVLKFKGDLYKFKNQTYDDVIYCLKLEFQHNPHLRTLEEGDTTQFEDIQCNYQCDGYDIFLSQW